MVNLNFIFFRILDKTRPFLAHLHFLSLSEHGQPTISHQIQIMSVEEIPKLPNPKASTFLTGASFANVSEYCMDCLVIYEMILRFMDSFTKARTTLDLVLHTMKTAWNSSKKSVDGWREIISIMIGEREN